jgi:hypothetical protein
MTEHSASPSREQLDGAFYEIIIQVPIDIYNSEVFEAVTDAAHDSVLSQFGDHADGCSGCSIAVVGRQVST